MTREFEHSLDRLPEGKSQSGNSLDIKQALKGQFVVKPQDTDSLKAQSGVKESQEVETTSSTSRSGHSGRGSSTRSSVGHYSLGPHRYFVLL